MVDTSTFLSALERVLINDIEKNEIVELMNNVPPEPSYKLIAEALHQSYHFLSDSDLREGDPEYDRTSRSDIIDYIASIRELGLP